MRDAFNGFYRGRKVLVTGHTGFKGSWLTVWLTALGADVVGYALDPPTEPSNFVACRLHDRIADVRGDVRDLSSLTTTFQDHRPEVVFHLAAQPLVGRSMREPHLTFDVNVLGTVSVLEAARHTASVRAAVMITSDKCYRNREWDWAYRETDELGGHDPYSASKACAELAIAVYRDARFQRAATPPRELGIASVRAGNVIGGGDWAADRIVPDTVRALTGGRDIVIRNPAAIRPWQHVLEPLSGYLWLGARMGAGDQRLATTWNFGPSSVDAVTVEDLVTRLRDKWPAPGVSVNVERDAAQTEATLLRLDSSKAGFQMQWRPTWTLDEGLEALLAWYRRFYEGDGGDMYALSTQHIEEFTRAAAERRIAWAGRTP